jgi:hypothetical protein
MDVDVDRIGGNLLRGFIALVFWMTIAVIIQFLVTPVIPRNWAFILSVVLGFIVVFVGSSYWYYRHSI